MRPFSLLVCLLLALGCGTAWAQSGYTIRQVDLKAQPFDDAPTVAKLAEKATVEITSRRGGWMQVTSGSYAGWLRMLQVRIGSPATQSSGSSGFASLFNIARSGSSGTAVTTGVRGLSKEEVANAAPNFAELQKLDAYATSRQDAARFAAGNPALTSQTVEYLTPAASSSGSGGGATGGSGPVPGSSPFSN